MPPSSPLEERAGLRRKRILKSGLDSQAVLECSLKNVFLFPDKSEPL
jgi:hypothetical protein